MLWQRIRPPGRSASRRAWQNSRCSRAKIEHMGEEQGLDSSRPDVLETRFGAVDTRSDGPEGGPGEQGGPGGSGGSGAVEVPHVAFDFDSERLSEQEYLDHAYTCLEEMSVRTGSAVADAAERAPGDWDATVAHIHLKRRLASISSDAGPLCFGRIDEERTGERSGPAWHIGRRHVEDGRGEPVVVDWRAPVAVPFYRATFHDTLGLRRRRRFILDDRQLVDLIEEDFEHPDSSALAAAGGLPDPLLAELGRARTGTMRDIVATIAGEQDRIIRAPLDVPIVVQGGPGTGKTAVGLHRAAFLLYEHRVQLEREGVLVLGPNRIFLSYIGEVLLGSQR
jgi:DNA helicase IV